MRSATARSAIVFLPLLASAWALYFFAAGAAHAAAADCGVEPPGANAIDSHSEVRLRRYIAGSGNPRNLTDEQQQRFDYLKWLDDCEKTARRERRLNQRRRSIADRLRLNESGKKAVPVRGAFDPYGPGSDPLDERVEIRVRRYANSDNCEAQSLTDEEHTRCVYLMRKRDDLTKSALKRRRFGLRSSRIPAGKRVPVSGKIKMVDMQKFSAGGLSAAKSTKFAEEEFDPSGPGSVRLHGALEVKAMRYADRSSCERAPIGEVMTRCKYLIKWKRHANKGAVQSAQSRLRSRGVSGVIRRGVSSVYRRSIRSMTGVLRERSSRGFRVRPRNAKDIESYKAPVIIGD